MKTYLFGAATILVVLAGIAYFYLSMGLMNTGADASPPRLESNYAMKFLDASVDRHALKEEDPVQPTDANLANGMRLYKTYCAMCHASPDHPERNFGHPFYPPAPDFLREAPDMQENENFYIIEHGVRWSAMPAWDDTLSDTQIWTLVTFLSRMGKLPPAVNQQWRTAQVSGGNNSKEERGSRNKLEKQPHAYSGKRKLP